ncbi:MAG: transcriptional repressor [Bacteroidales bacterium]|nr:transcriptional repressor [Bacteroidales bacterium]MBP5675989.1 transcriptional repressor [Bacteroidales bacterium]
MATAPVRPIPSMDEFRTQLRRHDLKATRQRLAVHEVMMELVHASAETVKEELSKRGSRVTTSSVYNILSQLADCRIYGRRMSAANKMFFDVISARHLHLYDRENHVWRDLVDENLDALVNAHLKRRKFKGFTIEDIDIQIVARPTRKK